jgi:hypothetical protein
MLPMCSGGVLAGGGAFLLRKPYDADALDAVLRAGGGRRGLSQ